MAYIEALDHHSENYNPQSLYKGLDANDIAFEIALRKMEENGEIYCLEANTLPGMTPTSLLPQEAAAAGMDYGQLCEKLIEVSLKARK